MNQTEKDVVNKALGYVRHTPACKVHGMSRLCTCGATDAVRAVGKLMQEADETIEALRKELAVTDQLLAARNEVLHAIPECPDHGSECIPHALEWLANAKQALPICLVLGRRFCSVCGRINGRWHDFGTMIVCGPCEDKLVKIVGQRAVDGAKMDGPTPPPA